MVVLARGLAAELRDKGLNYEQIATELGVSAKSVSQYLSDSRDVITGIDKAELLAALVNAARPIGMGILHAGGGPMTKTEAQEWIAADRGHDTASLGAGKALRFDYVKGRPIKCALGGDELNPILYDRDQGEGAAARVVAALRARMGTVPR